MIFHSSYGIDLGTDTIKICDKNEKNFLCEKNMIAIRDKVNVIALGQKAFEMYEKTPMNVEAGSPMTGGAIADVKNAELVLTGLLKRCGGVFTGHPEIFMSVPTESSEVEKRAYYNVLNVRIRAKKVNLIDKGLADAIGIGMPVLGPEGNMVVNIGADTTEISVISDGKIIVGKMLKFGGRRLDEEICTMVRRRYNLHIGMKTSEYLKKSLAYLIRGEDREAAVYGINTISGLPRQEVIPALPVSAAILEAVDEILESLKNTLERTPPQLLEDIRRSGIYITGGVSEIPNLAEYFYKGVGIPVYNVVEPAFSTIRGLVRIMNQDELQKLTYSMKDFTGNTI